MGVLTRVGCTLKGLLLYVVVIYEKHSVKNLKDPALILIPHHKTLHEFV